MPGEVVIVQYRKAAGSWDPEIEQFYDCAVPGHQAIRDENLGAHARASHGTPLYVILNDDGSHRPAFWPTGLSLNQNVEDWPTKAHGTGKMEMCAYGHDKVVVTIKLRRVGWLDQAGNVWVSDKEWRDAGAPHGSITALLVNPGCD
jgi:hypothetical protein